MAAAAFGRVAETAGPAQKYPKWVIIKSRNFNALKKILAAKNKTGTVMPVAYH